MQGAGVNLISQGEIYREGLHGLEIIHQGIRISDNMFARLLDNNLYLMDIFSLGQLALAAINKDTLKIWHFHLGHLGHQNIIWLENMSQGINLSQLPPKDVCIPCKEANMRVEPHINMLQPGLQLLDLVHNNLSTTGLYGARYYVIFLCDATKQSEAILHKKKVGHFLLLKSIFWETRKMTREFDGSRQTMAVNNTPRFLLNFEKKKVLYGSLSSPVTLKWIAKQIS